MTGEMEKTEAVIREKKEVGSKITIRMFKKVILILLSIHIEIKYKTCLGIPIHLVLFK